MAVYQGMILDGRNRYLACQEAGVEPKFLAYEGDDDAALAFVISLNVNRRHMDASQRAMAAADLSTLRQGQKKANAQICASQSDNADLLNVSRRSVQTAQKVKEQGSEELKKAVRAGEVTVSKAAEVAHGLYLQKILAIGYFCKYNYRHGR